MRPTSSVLASLSCTPLLFRKAGRPATLYVRVEKVLAACLRVTVCGKLAPATRGVAKRSAMRAVKEGILGGVLASRPGMQPLYACRSIQVVCLGRPLPARRPSSSPRLPFSPPRRWGRQSGTKELARNRQVALAAMGVRTSCEQEVPTLLQTSGNVVAGNLVTPGNVQGACPRGLSARRYRMDLDEKDDQHACMSSGLTSAP